MRYAVQAGFFGDEGPATAAKLNFFVTETCGKICIDGRGYLYIADTKNHCVRVVDAAGIIHRFAGLYPATPGYGGDGGPATSAMLNEPRDIACDTHGNVFIADTGNHIIRKVDPQGVITTVAGIPMVSGSRQEDGKLATQSTLNLPYGIELDAAGRLWIADTQNSRIRVVY
jgi:sugar lactone lactonase YvrE